MSSHRQRDPAPTRLVGINGQVTGCSERVFLSIGPSTSDLVVLDAANLIKAVDSKPDPQDYTNPRYKGHRNTTRALEILENEYLADLFGDGRDKPCTAVFNPWKFDSGDGFWVRQYRRQTRDLGLCLRINSDFKSIRSILKKPKTSSGMGKETLSVYDYHSDPRKFYDKAVEASSELCSLIPVVAEMAAANKREEMGHVTNKSKMTDHEILFCVANAPPPLSIAQCIRPMGLGALESGPDLRPLLYVDIRTRYDKAVGRNALGVIPGILYLAVFFLFEIVPTGYGGSDLKGKLVKKLCIVPLIAPFDQDPQVAGARFLHSYRVGEWNITWEKVGRQYIGDAISIAGHNDRLYRHHNACTQLKAQFDFDRILTTPHQPIVNVTSGMAMIRCAEVRIAGKGDVPHPAFAHPALSEEVLPLRTQMASHYKMSATPKQELVTIEVDQLVKLGIESPVAQAAGIMRQIGYVGHESDGYKFCTIPEHLLKKSAASTGVLDTGGRFISFPTPDLLQGIVSKAIFDGLFPKVIDFLKKVADDEFQIPVIDFSVTEFWQLDYVSRCYAKDLEDRLKHASMCEFLRSLERLKDGAANGNEYDFISDLKDTFRKVLESLFVYFHVGRDEFADYNSAEKLAVGSKVSAAFCAQFVAVRVLSGVPFWRAKESLFSSCAEDLKALDSIYESGESHARINKKVCDSFTEATKTEAAVATRPMLYAKRCIEKSAEPDVEPRKNSQEDYYRSSVNDSIKKAKDLMRDIEEGYRSYIGAFGFSRSPGVQFVQLS